MMEYRNGGLPVDIRSNDRGNNVVYAQLLFCTEARLVAEALPDEATHIVNENRLEGLKRWRV